MGINLPPPCYQAKEKCEDEDSLVKLSEISLNKWIEIWEPVVEKLPKATLKPMPKLLRQVERISLDESKVTLSTIGKENAVKRDD